MASIIAGAAKFAHHAVAGALASSQIEVGHVLPDIPLKTNAETADVKIRSAPGKIIIVRFF